MISVAKNERMKELRYQQKKPQALLALETSIDSSTISRIEGGYLRPSKRQSEAIAKALGVEVEWLFGETDGD